MGVAEHYTYRVRWSREAGEYVGTIAELPSLSWLSPDRTEAFAGIQQLAADAVADMLGYGETPAGGDRRPRLLRQVHGPDPARAPRQLAIDAAEQHVSLNRLISGRLGA